MTPAPTAEAATRPRRLLPAMRGVLIASTVLTALGFGSLYLLSGNTEKTFAWTIQPPLTAAFLGAGYGAGLLLVVLTLRDGVWVRGRVPVYTILLFVVLTLVPTLMHLDRFHFSPEFEGLDPLAKGAAWFWLAVYLGLPLLIAPVLAVQERAAGVDPPRRHPVPRGLQIALAVEAAVLLVIGVALFVAPASATTLWPWPLTPLTARVVAAWLIAFGVAAAVAIRGDLDRLRIATLAYTALGVLNLLAVVRFPGDVVWDQPAAWAFLTVNVAIVVTGLEGRLAAPKQVGAHRG